METLQLLHTVKDTCDCLFGCLQESCRCTNILATAVPDQFYFQANSLVNPLLKSLSHQHSKVRVSCIKVRVQFVVHFSSLLPNANYNLQGSI